MCVPPSSAALFRAWIKVDSASCTEAELALGWILDHEAEFFGCKIRVDESTKGSLKYSFQIAQMLAK